MAVTADGAPQTWDYMQSDGLGFPIVIDPDGTTIRRWGLTEQGETHSVPATFVIDRGGVIIFATVGETMSERADPDELLGVLDRSS